ncbi:MAG: aspartate--tRNA ligase [Actinobacteria bacterium]|nr:aspartate--tRNA ligase [Actinomycetota bacterium]
MDTSDDRRLANDRDTSGASVMSSASATSMRTQLCGEVGIGDVGAKVSLCGWVSRRREHGEHLAFIDLRDHSGIVQCVVSGSLDVRSEFVVRVEGTVRERPVGTVNENLSTGMVEIGDCVVEVLARSQVPPFVLDGRVEVDEPLRMRYRYLDLRTDRMQRNLRMRAKANAQIRQTMASLGFCEVETPLLWAPTPEGAREFVVPSRLSPQSFYALPQSPQLAKQMLMVGGIDRYYQIARCMRDEDLRSDRQFEFTQLDMEASFVGQEDVIGFVSEVINDATEALTGVTPDGFERITWAESIDRFGTDKPDLRFAMELVDLTGAFASTNVKAFSGETVKALCVEGGGQFSRSRLDSLVERAKALGAAGLAWFKVNPGEGGELELESPLARHLDSGEITAVFKETRCQAGDLILVVSGEYQRSCLVLGQIRIEIADTKVGDGRYRYVWVVDFPMFDGVDASGCPIPAHHPFTMANPADLELLKTEPRRVRSQAYDLVLNGWELGSGSVRIHRRDVQNTIFEILGITKEDAESRFGFLLDAFDYGAPPHAGFAFGIDRLVSIFAGEESIRDVVAFPKTQSGSDPMTGAPKAIGDAAMKELGLAARSVK